jgi:putative nucleotidyltransferase with HDIG domain
MASIDEFLDRVEYLPPMPRNVAALTELLGKGEVDVAEVVEIIQFDPALTAEVLRLCNSAFFGSATPASDLSEAVMRLGFNEIFQLVMILSVASLMSGENTGHGLPIRDLWRHSVATALSGKVVATARHEDTSLIFTACILHDLGKIVFAHGLENEYDTVIALAQNSQSPVFTAEQSVLSFDHAELGGRLLERWQFPAELVSAVRFHHQPVFAPAEHRKLAAYAHLGDMMACFMGYDCGQSVLALNGRVPAMELVGINCEELTHCLVDAWSSLHDTQAMISFSEFEHRGV